MLSFSPKLLCELTRLNILIYYFSKPVSVLIFLPMTDRVNLLSVGESQRVPAFDLLRLY